MTKETTYTLTFYMKSGNKIVMSNVVQYKIDSDTEGVNHVSISHREVDGSEILLTSTLDLSQIEAVTRTKYSN